MLIALGAASAMVAAAPRYGRVDLLEIDALGYLELDRQGAEMLFQVLTAREEKNSIAIAFARTRANKNNEKR